MPSLLYLRTRSTNKLCAVCLGNEFLGKERTEEEPFYGFVVRYKEISMGAAENDRKRDNMSEVGSMGMNETRGSTEN